MRHLVILILIIVASVCLWLDEYEQCQCYLLMALLYNNIYNDVKKGE